MYSGSQSSSTNQVSVIGIVVSAVFFAIAATLNIVPVATAYWLSLSVKGSEVLVGSDIIRVNFGLWSICGHESFTGQSQCVDTSNIDLSDFKLVSPDYVEYVQAARALSIAAAAMCLISVPLAMVGYALKNEAPVFGAAVVAFIQSAAFATALLLFSLKTWSDILSIVGDLDDPLNVVNVQVSPGWSFYVGGSGVVAYFLGSLFFATTGVLMLQGRRHRSANGVITEESHTLNYRQLVEI